MSARNLSNLWKYSDNRTYMPNIRLVREDLILNWVSASAEDRLLVATILLMDCSDSVRETKVFCSDSLTAAKVYNRAITLKSRKIAMNSS